ncbi:hypothetical protein FHL15_002662 [Xylaria flabelliformis]|uniref:Uncharacterized protein n=1 Tax=Xylaria flabelliformis TaxID=2512241 RepID=A0A553I860_9PEZI|nr:hypothetical protein FHL15_002662 [Xylaria flabelliformis]
MSTQTSPIPVVLVGIHTEIGEPVSAGLRPDFDVIRFIQTFAAAQSDLPHLLQGKEPPTAPTNSVGSGDYSHGPARAVLFGRGFSQQQAEELYNANKDIEGVVWIAGEEAKRPKDVKDIQNPPPGTDKVIVPIFKGLLEKWVKEGGKGGLLLY